MIPKPACHLFSFSLLFPPFVSLCVSCPTYGMLTHAHSNTHTCTHTHKRLLSFLIHRTVHQNTPLTAQPLQVVTEDTCLFHYLVPAPMSPSNKSVGSDAGSQDSADGNAGPRSVMFFLFLFTCMQSGNKCNNINMPYQK